MDRVIKFRAWDGNHNRFYYPDVIELDVGIEYQQYTGLKDKNGTEIYEADIIRHEKTGAIGEVVWYGAEWGIVWYPETDKASYNSLDVDRHYEVIGNKFENPELLDQ